MGDVKSYWSSFPPVGVTPSGEAVIPVFSWNKEKTELVETGKRDLQKEHNAAAVGVTPYEVIEMCVRTGDLADYSDPGNVVDVSAAPESLSEAVSMVAADDASKAAASAVGSGAPAPAASPVEPAAPAPEVNK